MLHINFCLQPSNNTAGWHVFSCEPLGLLLLAPSQQAHRSDYSRDLKAKSGHIRVHFPHGWVVSPEAMNTVLHACPCEYKNWAFPFLSVHMVHRLKQAHSHAHVYAHTYGVTECTGWAQMNQQQPGEGGMCMAWVQERPSESSAGNPGCLSEHKCVCGSLCICTKRLVLVVSI